MNEKLLIAFYYVEAGGFLAPIAFILFHLLRQFLFIPVAIVIISGGVLFGTLCGTIYSLIGLMLVNLLFYFMIKKMPNIHKKLLKIKKRWFGEYRNLTVSQITILRLIPFIHYHLLNFCLIERNGSLKEYMKGALISNVPLILFYTVFGEFISRFTPTMILIILFALVVLVYALREKVTVIKWQDFFKATV
ncbi:TVP38/TMEM64 family protein [Bacillus aquiflavi]|uniref:TVP38/TMEM64 family membrane protein n=1 Tax=Bacillus aquiflavi TaxID=2672567 RepID=A0A6B3VZG8_9BACI|nr:VTT domain-containing protein [Bacillus aquiflavi]MBA4538329.1 TVP38/TMEM64 family protein [Bacillus aquiflavi]NEY82648.1 TVP38/TMEM64 family protein [Bacillus aquiflavi]UAC47510.1 VTT domain-containing protein [Bacillus aquiflavi]